MQVLSLLLLFTLSVIHQSSCIPVVPIQLPHLAYISIPEENGSNTPLSNRENSAQQQDALASESSAHIGYGRTFGSMGLGFRGYTGSRDAGSTYGSSSLIGNLFNAGNGYRSYGWYGNSPGASTYNSYGNRYSGGTLGTNVGYINGAESRYGGGGGWRG